MRPLGLGDQLLGLIKTCCFYFIYNNCGLCISGRLSINHFIILIAIFSNGNFILCLIKELI